MYKRDPVGVQEEEEDHDEFLDYYSRYRPQGDTSSRSVYSMSGTTSEAGTLSSSVSGLGSSRYSSTTGSSSIRRGPAGDMRDVARDRQMARRRLNIRSKSTGREMDPRFQDIANVYSHPAGLHHRDNHPGDPDEISVHQNFVNYEDSVSRDSGNSSGGTPEFGRRTILKQNSVPPFNSHVTTAEVYNRPYHPVTETEIFQRQSPYHQSEVGTLEPSDSDKVIYSKHSFDTISLNSAPRDDLNTFSYDSMSLRSLDNHLQNWSPLSEEVRPKIAAKRKLDSFKEDKMPCNGSPMSKRPCTPEHSKNKQGSVDQHGGTQFKTFFARAFRMIVILFFVATSLILCLVCFASYKSWQCANYRTGKIDICRLRQELSSQLFGQHIAAKEIADSLQTFLDQANDSPDKKVLVLLLTGWLGSGKTHTANIISRVFPVPSNVHTLLAPLHLTSQASSALTDLASLTSRSCGYNLVVLDDIDTSDGTTNRILERFLVSVANNDEHKSNGTVVVATANTGGSVINRLMLDRHRQLLARERVTGDEVREELRQQAADIPLVANLADYNIPVKVIPYLPLTREHVRQCVGRELQNHHATLSAKDLNNLLDQVQFFSQDFPVFAKTGCKQISARVNLALGANSEL